VSCVYEVKLSFVDTTYWDDGSRLTSRAKIFHKRKDALEHAREAATVGVHVNGRDGELFVHPQKLDISVVRISRSSVEWREKT
jgi:hypothetical protein